MRKIGIIGSTGSIGTQTLEVIKELNAEGSFEFQVTALSCGNNAALLARQAREFGVKLLAIDTDEGALFLEKELADMHPTILKGEEGLVELAKSDMDVLVTAIVGMRGIAPTLAAIEQGTEIALANKETLVAAGSVVTEAAKRKGVRILPVDSEHSAIFQCMQSLKKSDVQSIILTCSGGPFRTYPIEKLSTVTVSDALKHPTWNMGGKITIDCATLMNKGLEVIEAKWLYDMPYDKIEVIIHPQSIIHSLVRCQDGAVLAQLGTPTMKLPIQYALTYPTRVKAREDHLDLAKVASMTFEDPDCERFPCLRIAYEAGFIGGTMPAAMNAADEAAVRLFFEGKIGFNDIPKIVSRHLERHKLISSPTADEILSISEASYEEVYKQ